MTKGLDCEWSVNGGLSDFSDEALKLLLTKGGNILQIKCLSVPEYFEVYGNNNNRSKHADDLFICRKSQIFYQKRIFVTGG